MRLSRLLIVTLLLGFVVGLPRTGLSQETSPYSVVVPVTDVSDAQRSQAFSTALGQVLARVSGGQDLTSKAGYADALQNAGGIVKHFQYQRGEGNPPSLTLDVSFDQGAVQRLITQLGATTAGVKPPLLLVLKGADGNLLGKDALGVLTDTASKRGYQVSYADPTQLPDLGKLESADPAAMSAIARLYHTGLVLVGELHGNGADWTLISGGQAQHWSAQGSDQNSLFADGGNAAADRLGQALNVIGSGPVEGKLWVSGLHSAMDYANLMATLRSDPSVQKVETLGGQEDGVLLTVKSAMPLDGLAANLTAGGRLMQGSAHDGADVSLRWLH
ncbi:DUF2066 domain-containing protein [Dyella mobilis]|uniref:DUF2066 domain-containing protein n=1 Tax=Dyella mobilis TaxID=1849582 RepID=A0ABS2KHG2_9GAMM|nr:DUF2066 domain-containing protein [Dyella mobilis]MBM7130384.1 DUF2066 domain-containing protein [Dyella mobilis]GLQ97010.1 hypothetical protein GCM10007863_14300 [Dyella mobilis]